MGGEREVTGTREKRLKKGKGTEREREKRKFAKEKETGRSSSWWGGKKKGLIA